MRGGLERRSLADPPPRRMGALARRAARSVSNGDEARRQRLEPLDDGPQPLLHLGRLRREENETKARRGAPGKPAPSKPQTAAALRQRTTGRDFSPPSQPPSVGGVSRAAG